MNRRSGVGGKPAKSRHRKTAMLKHRNAPKTKRNRGVSIASQKTVVARLTRERDEALLRETANFEILRLISKSPGNLELVFRTILEDATRICNAISEPYSASTVKTFTRWRNSIRLRLCLRRKRGVGRLSHHRAPQSSMSCGQNR